LAKRISIKQIRRRELIEATRSVIAINGFESTTIAAIAKQAGFSIGFIHHHFDSKGALLAETMRVVYSDMRRIIIENIRGISDPVERFKTIIAGNLDEQIFTRENAYIWVSFVPRVPFDPDCRRMQRVIERRQYSNIRVELIKVLTEDKAQALLEEVSMLINAYWLRLAIDELEVKQLHTLATGHLDKLMSTYFEAEVPGN